MLKDHSLRTTVHSTSLKSVQHENESLKSLLFFIQHKVIGCLSIILFLLEKIEFLACTDKTW